MKPATSPTPVSCAPKMMPPARIDFPSVKGGKSYEEAVHGRADRRDLARGRIGRQDGRTLARQHGVSEPTIYGWRNKYGGMEQAEVRRLRELEKENARLKRLLAERDVEIDVLKEFLKKSRPRAGTPGSGRLSGTTRRHGPACLLAPGSLQTLEELSESPQGA